MCDIWKIRAPQEIPIERLERQLDSFEELHVSRVALTGGEPERHTHFDEFARALKARGIQVTMLTAGMQLEEDARRVVAAVDDVIVSLDGPPVVHDRIRRVPGAFEKLAAGVLALKKIQPTIPIGGRCTVQRANHDVLCRTVEHAEEIGLDSISFLAADLTSHAFNRAAAWNTLRQGTVALDEREVDSLEEEIERLIAAYAGVGFVVESADKLRRIVLHFRAHLGQALPVAPRCNAPWVSAVVEASGEVRPCFFHASIGSIYDNTLTEVVNGPAARQFRSQLDMATNPTCRRCVCSLYLPQVRNVSDFAQSAFREAENHRSD
jgi:MoaA/NifB/PqqE/SkfB family radical SAM enzyme